MAKYIVITIGSANFSEVFSIVKYADLPKHQPELPQKAVVEISRNASTQT